MALILVTLIGFGTHGTLVSGAQRLLATGLPMILAWLLAAWPMGLLGDALPGGHKAYLKLAYAMLLAAPLGIWLRSLWLNDSAEPVFTLVMGLVSLAGLVIWRGGYTILRQRVMRNANG